MNGFLFNAAVLALLLAEAEAFSTLPDDELAGRSIIATSQPKQGKGGRASKIRSMMCHITGEMHFCRLGVWASDFCTDAASGKKINLSAQKKKDGKPLWCGSYREAALPEDWDGEASCGDFYLTYEDPRSPTLWVFHQCQMYNGRCRAYKIPSEYYGEELYYTEHCDEKCAETNDEGSEQGGVVNPQGKRGGSGPATTKGKTWQLPEEYTLPECVNREPACAIVDDDDDVEFYPCWKFLNKIRDSTR